jgi:hypothetical protein
MMLKDWLAVWYALSVTCTVTEQVCAVVGAPVIAPEPATRVSPAHSEPEVTLQVKGPTQLAV